MSAERRATYAALVEAVASAGTSLVDASDIRGATSRFAAIYAADIDSNRSAADATLDLIEKGAGSTRFSSMGRGDRLAHLRGILYDRQFEDSSHAHLRVAAVQAVRLAAIPFYPHGPDDPVPTPTI